MIVGAWKHEQEVVSWGASITQEAANFSSPWKFQGISI